MEGYKTSKLLLVPAHCGFLRTLYPLDKGMCRSGAEKTFQLGKRFFRAVHHDFNTSIRQVAGITRSGRSPAHVGQRTSETHPLHHSEHQEPCSHAGRLRRARNISIAIGRTEIAMIARMTRLKFSRTTAMLPKK